MASTYGTSSVTDYLEGLADYCFLTWNNIYWPAWLLRNGTIQAVAKHSDYHSADDVHTAAIGALRDGCVRLTVGCRIKDKPSLLCVEFRNTMTTEQRRSVLEIARERDYDQVIAEVTGDCGTFIDRGTFVGTNGLNNFLLKFEDTLIAA